MSAAWTVAALRRAAPLIAVATLLVAALTYAVSSQVPHSYKDSAYVAVTPGDNAIDRGSIGASNALANRYAALVRNPNVIGRVAERNHDLTRELSLALTGGTVGGQNLIAVRATATTAAQAQARANTAAEELVTYIDERNAAQRSAFDAVAERQLRPLDRQLHAVQERLAAADDNRATADQQTLSVLQAQRAAIRADNARTASSDVPAVAVVTRAGAAERVAPRPLLYALVALLVTPLLAAQLVLLVGAYRRPA